MFFMIYQKIKKKKKTYNEEFGNDNDLKKFWNTMKTNGAKFKEN